MIMKVYSVYDSKAKAYLPPFFATNGAVAGRMMQEACSDPKHQFHKFAPDYTLMELADFDDDTGVFTPHASQNNLGNLQTFIPSGGSNA